jgi:hypothetical protein
VSPHVAEFEDALVKGEGILSLARRTGLGRMALSRHKAHMLTRRREREALDRRAIASGQPPSDPVRDLFRKVRALEAKASGVLRRASRKGGRDSTALAAIRELCRLAELGARGSAALQPPAQAGTIDVGKLIAEAALRLQTERKAEWERRRGMNVRQLLDEAVRLVDAEDASAIGAVAAALRALQGERALLAAPIAVEVVNESVPDAVVSAESESAKIVAFRPPDEKPRERDEPGKSHRPGHIGCSTFWCAAAMVVAQDGDERESIGEQWEKSGF